MSDLAPLADVLGRYMRARGLTFEDLAKESGLPRNTVYRWLKGEVRKPQTWQPLATVAATLGLSKSQTNTLLQAAQHLSVEELLDRVRGDEDRELLSQWAVTAPNNLPCQMTSFVGREEEIVNVGRRLSLSRLVTLTGPGGCGKTRLAIEAAEAALGEFEDGVYFVGLASIRDPALVIPVISQVLDAGESVGKSSIEALKAHLRDKRVLLLLDNFEQVLDAAPLIVELLTAAPRVKVLVTSRTWLHVSGEHELPIQPLPTPNPRSAFGELRANPAVTLFTDRARAVSSDFAVTRENAPLIAEICALLDGLPLAIELAAARTRRFTLSKMLERFPSRLDLGSDGPRDADQRHRSLRCMISWSYDLLCPDEQKLFRRLAVFVGGCPEDAVMDVSNLSGNAGLDVPAGLDSLIENNLLRQTSGIEGERRFEMLETIQEYARELLEESGELESSLRAHADFYLELLETREPEFYGPRQTYWLDRLELEINNFRAALRWCQERGEVARGLRMSTALLALWEQRSHHGEGGRWLAYFADADQEVPQGLRAKALLWHGLLLLRHTSDATAADLLFARAYALFCDIGEASMACETLQAQGDLAVKQGNVSGAQALFAESLDLARQAGDNQLTARAYLKLAKCAEGVGDYETAQCRWELSLQAARDGGHRAWVAQALLGLGETARHRQDLDMAQDYYRQALDLGQQAGIEWIQAMSLHNLGHVACYRGDYDEAIGAFRESLSLHVKREFKKGIGECLAGLAAAAALQGETERAARLCGSADALLASIAERLDPADRADYERTLRTARSRLAGESFDALFAEGRGMSLEQGLEYASEG